MRSSSFLLNPALLGLVAIAVLGAACSTELQGTTLNRRPIINGTVDTTDTSVVALVYQGQQFCTGTVIAPRWILSAGHCLVEMAGEVGQGFETQSKIFFGTTVGGSGQSIAVTEAHAHPQYYTRSDGAPMYDVSVWKMASDAPVAAMPWQQTTLANPTGDTVRLVGYGVTNAQSQSGNGTRRQVENQVTDMDNMFVYYGNGSSGTCQGDSGGPMFLDGVVIGVCSFGDSTCVQEGANTRVDIFADFIQQYVGTSTTQPQPVTVTITAPASNATVSPSFTVSATATSTAGVAQVSVSVDGTVKQTLSSAPYDFSLTNVAAGTHTIVVKGTGTDGGTGQATIHVTVQATTTGCGTGPACQTGYDCVNGACVPHNGCGGGPACSTGYDCINGACVPHNGCGGGPACSTGYDCINGACVPHNGCGGGPACSTGYDCVNGACVPHDGCGGGPACDSGFACVNGSCVPQLSGCGNGPACDSGFACVNGSCVPQLSGCGDGPACSAGYDCVNGTCVVTTPGGDTGNGGQTTTVSGSSGCQAGGTGSPLGGLGFLLLALALVVRGRR
jgi:V8-like Glu-specific endopeptidase